MNNIELLDQKTIDKIAAGEVVERPSSIVKELVENAIDAKANAITVEIKDGGVTFIRITDNGHGINKEDIKTAFLRHSTSKIRTIEDLNTISSLGFRGEALSSIAAVSMVELITKTNDSILGTRYVIEGGMEKSIEDIGAPQGTTFIIRNLFYNTPARVKFLKSYTTEGNYISTLMERLALSKPDISFKFIQNNQVKLYTSGNGNLKDIIYNIYGKEISSNLIEINSDNENLKIKGFIGKPVVNRGNRNYENYFVNGRYIKNNIITKGIEDGYKSFLMQHKYPFTVLCFEINGKDVDVNVHPSKMEVRFSNGAAVYDEIYNQVNSALGNKPLIPEVHFEDKKTKNEEVTSKVSYPEPFEANRRIENELLSNKQPVVLREENTYNEQGFQKDEKINISTEESVIKETVMTEIYKPKATTKDEEQLELFSRREVDKVKVIGQIFDTYWIIQYTDKLFIIDQHAAHEKVLYERILKDLKEKRHTSQLISPPIVITLNMIEEQLINDYMSQFKEIGFEIEHFGGKEYVINAVPGNLYNLSAKELFLDMLDSLSDIRTSKNNPEIVLDRIATMSCKAAVKGENKLSPLEWEALFNELVTLENPYNCPHGRPTIISMSKYELEKKFKRIL